MDRQAFKQRMQNLKSYRENNPGKGYWDWKVEAFVDGGVNDNLIGSYSNHTGTPTMYLPVTKEYEAVPEGFGEIANVHTPEVTITPQSNISLVEAVDKGRRDAAPYVGAIVAGATLPAMSSTNMLGKAIDLANIVLDPTNPANYVKIPNIRLGRWSAKFPEYGNQNKAFRQVNVDAVDDYINTGVVGPESEAHNAMRSVQNANKNSRGGSKHSLILLTKHFGTHVMFNKTKPFYGKDSKYPRVLVGDLRNPRINWKKVNHKGHKNIVEPVDPSAGNFTVPIEEFDIWRKAKIGWLRDQKANRFAEGGQTMVASGRLQAKPFAEERFNKTGVGAEPNEFDLWVNTGMYRDPMQLANHEMNHYTDYIISRNIDTSVNNNMLKQLENSLKQTDATDYYRKGTEQKAYMNQLRTMLKQNGDIQNLDEPVSSTLLKKYLDKMSDSDPIKKMFKQHKNINAYTKWFNAIPLLGTTALGANAYFNNNKNE